MHQLGAGWPSTSAQGADSREESPKATHSHGRKDMIWSSFPLQWQRQKESQGGGPHCAEATGDSVNRISSHGDEANSTRQGGPEA